MLDIIVDILDQAVLSECLNWYIIVDILDQAVLCRVAKEETCKVVEDTSKTPRGSIRSLRTGLFGVALSFPSDEEDKV